MSSIRPLITITLIVAAGVYFFNKINQGHAPLPAEADVSLEQAPAFEVPPLAGDAAPAATASTPLLAVQPPTTLTAEVPAPQSLPTESAELPPIPELPPVAATGAVASAPVAEATAPSVPLPANIPVAQYPGDVSASAPVAEQMTPPAPITSLPLAQNTDQASLPEFAESAAPPPLATVVSGDDRYGAPAGPETTTTATPAILPESNPAPAPPTFAASWPEIQGALERQELVAAHVMLSRWYGNPTLTPAETQQLEALLGQLAGTIVYSTEHRLEPPYTVKPGDTLQTIAQQYEVPWQLLAKINGVADPNGLQAGQQLKVVHGPFAAVVELDKRQLTLMLDGRYAGRFPASIEQGTTVSEGQWVLDQKLVQPRTQDSTVVSASYASPTLDHVLVLRNESPAAGGATIAITGGPSTPSGPKVEVPKIQLSPRDVEEVADILSVGSTVTIRR